MMKILFIGSFAPVILISIPVLISGLLKKRKIIWISGAILFAVGIIGCYSGLTY